MSNLFVVLTMASCIGCFWLGFQIGRGRAEQARRRAIEDLERRFRIVESDAVAAAAGPKSSTISRLV